MENSKLNDWVTVKVKDRQVILEVDEENLKEISKLDGCYALKTDLPKETADKDLIHNRYKDLTKVEMAFRTCKTTHLEIRPVHVRTEASTRGPCAGGDVGLYDSQALTAWLGKF